MTHPEFVEHMKAIAEASAEEATQLRKMDKAAAQTAVLIGCCCAMAIYFAEALEGYAE